MNNKHKGYDMHCHTAASDGKLSITDLVAVAKKADLEGFLISDHDILIASKQAAFVSEKSGLDIIPGVELSGKISDYLIDVIGYFVDPFDKELEEACRINQDFRKARMGKMVYKINEMYKGKLKEEIKYEEVLAVSKEGSIGLNHLNQILVSRGLFKDREAFSTCLNKNHDPNCYVERDSIELMDVIKAILNAGGLVGIPHPSLVSCDYPGEITDADFASMIKGYFGKHIKVIEVDYPYSRVRPECKITKEQEDFWRNVAKDNNLIGVGGSDGHQKPDGPSLGERRTNKKIVYKIKELAKNPRLF
jgi:hypothetical protein